MLVWVLGSGRELRGSAWRLQKQHPPWTSQSDGFRNDAKCPKPTESEQGAPGCCTLRGQQCGPHRKKEPLQIRAVPTPKPLSPSFIPHQVTFQPHSPTGERLSLGWLLFRSNLLEHRRLTKVKLQPCDPPDLRGQKFRGDCEHPPCHLREDFRRRLPFLSALLCIW